MLVCGVLASLAVGVLIAYGVCLGLFAVVKMHARQVAAARPSQPAAPRLETVQN